MIVHRVLRTGITRDADAARLEQASRVVLDLRDEYFLRNPSLPKPGPTLVLLRRLFRASRETSARHIHLKYTHATHECLITLRTNEDIAAEGGGPLESAELSPVEGTARQDAAGLSVATMAPAPTQTVNVSAQPRRRGGRFAEGLVSLGIVKHKHWIQYLLMHAAKKENIELIEEGEHRLSVIDDEGRRLDFTCAVLHLFDGLKITLTPIR